MAKALELSIVGLGRIGGGLAARALEQGLHVVGYTRGRAPAALTRGRVGEIFRPGR